MAGVLKLVTGSIVAQAIVFASAPVLTRIYSPADFGAYALLAAGTNLVAVLFCGRYDLAIMLDEEDNDAAMLLLLSFCVATVCFIAVQTGASLLGSEALAALGVPNTQGWLRFLAVGTYVTALFEISLRWLSRKDRFGLLASARVGYSMTMICVQLVVGYLSSHPDGVTLMVGMLLGRGVSLLIVAPSIGQDLWPNRDRHAVRRCLASARKYWRFPAYSLPSGILGRLVLQYPNFALPHFGAAVLGQYALTVRVLQAPLSLVGGAVSQVFFPRIAQIRSAPAQARSLLIRTYITLFALMIGPAIVVAIWSEPLFALAFGPEWAKAGRFAALLLPMMVTQFVVAPTTLSMQAFGRQFAVLVWMAVFLGLAAASFWWGRKVGDPEAGIIAYSAAGTVMYLIYMKMSLHAVLRPIGDEAAED